MDPITNGRRRPRSSSVRNPPIAHVSLQRSDTYSDIMTRDITAAKSRGTTETGNIASDKDLALAQMSTVENDAAGKSDADQNTFGV